MLVARTEPGDTAQTHVEVFCDDCGGTGYAASASGRGFDPSAKLDSGMSVGEAVERASAWWDQTGRHLIAKEKNQQRTVYATPAGAAAAISRAELADVIPSGILRGLPWDQLDQREKLQVVRTWHHHHVEVPDVEPARRHLADHLRDQRLGMAPKELHGQRAAGMVQRIKRGSKR
jgi:hypothetical protein